VSILQFFKFSGFVAGKHLKASTQLLSSLFFRVLIRSKLPIGSGHLPGPDLADDVAGSKGRDVYSIFCPSAASWISQGVEIFETFDFQANPLTIHLHSHEGHQPHWNLSLGSIKCTSSPNPAWASIRGSTLAVNLILRLKICVISRQAWAFAFYPFPDDFGLPSIDQAGNRKLIVY